MRIKIAHFYFLFFFTTLFLMSACKKKTNCGCQKAVSHPSNIANIDALENAPKLQDTLNKYDQLEVFRVIDDQYLIGIHCHIYYQGLQVFGHDYSLFESKSDDDVTIIGDSMIVKTIPISLKPTISCQKAARIARENMKFNKMCLLKQLGIYDLNAGKGMTTADYKLAWRVAVKRGEAPYVYIDANSGEVYSKFDGSYNLY